MVGVQLPAEMMDGAVIMNSVCTGVTSLDGKPVSMTAEYARSGIDPAMGVACGAAGMSQEESQTGTKLLRIVGGTDHPEVAALGFGEKLGHQTGIESEQVGMPHTGIVPGRGGPDGRSV